MPICKLCGADTRLVKAHIIPEAFYRDLKTQKDSPLHMLATDADEYVRRSQTGEYDSEIVCRVCEDLFQPYDDYAADLLINNRDTAFTRRRAFDRDVFTAKHFDYSKLKLFIVSVLWRGSESGRKFFARISLGPRASIAKQMIKDGNPGSRFEFSAVLSRWTVPPGASLPPKLMANPYADRIDGVRTARLYLGSFVVDLSTERRPLPPPLIKAVISPMRPLVALGRDLMSSKDLRVFHDRIMRYDKPR
jgi:hypothetical protein